MGRPHGYSLLKTFEPLVNMASEPSGLQIGVTVFTSGTGNNVVGVQAEGNLLETVADSQNGDAQLEEGRCEERPPRTRSRVLQRE